ncbi:DSD1 family PLP-dependent enzyme [Bosea robiniae]|uniref:D-serine deaminase, pyridoxal phosphate-dependent n=1 Tax=Bosea robiniae TaxID=1036780 RepID=A0ABY0P084_9HYPH|nr:DSD1 family PLP-dependent enzyme [Bosea robiniae]SDG52495.1 D-serine deaminase, pyridoxal phosphate-dependent [Bosea robiniae]
MSRTLFGAAALNKNFVGEEGSRARLETPAAVLDLDLFEHNIALMAQTCRKAGLSLRPHAKSHKCAEITRRQMAAGALGNCCAKPGELLALFEGGVRDLLLSAPIASPAKIEALARAAAAGGRIGVVVDRADLATAYAEAAQRHGTAFDVLVDLDVGLKRSGVATPVEAVELARLVSGLHGLRYRGVQAYQGRVQHIDDFIARRAANQEMGRLLASMIEALREAGMAPEIVSGGGTGSHLLDGEDHLLTEIQAGSYVFMDEAYGSVDMHGRGGPEFKPALRIAVTIIGHSSLGFAITDGGSKSFALDGPPPRVFLNGELVGRIEWCGDEFGRVLASEGQSALPIGTVVECTVPHCDPTINLHDVLHVVQNEKLVALWMVEARGRAD